MKNKIVFCAIIALLFTCCFVVCSCVLNNDYNENINSNITPLGFEDGDGGTDSAIEETYHYNTVYNNKDGDFDTIISLSKKFSAPSGYALPITLQAEKLYEVIQAPSIYITISYNIDGMAKTELSANFTYNDGTMTTDGITPIGVIGYVMSEDGITYQDITTYVNANLKTLVLKNIDTKHEVFASVQIEANNTVVEGSKYDYYYNTYYYYTSTISLDKQKDGDFVTLFLNYFDDYRESATTQCSVSAQVDELLLFDSEYGYDVVKDAAMAPVYTWSYIINDSLSFETESPDFYLSTLPSDQFSMKAACTFSTTDGETYTFYSNSIDVVKYELELKINGRDVDVVGINETNYYSVTYNFNAEESGYSCDWWLSGDSLEESISLNGNPFEYSFSKVGTISIDVSYNYISTHANFMLFKTFEITVQEDAPAYATEVADVTFNIANNTAAIIDGGSFEIESTLQNVTGITEIDSSWTLSTSGVISILETNDNIIKVIPLSVGTVSVFCTYTSSNFDAIIGELILNVIKITDTNVQIEFKDSFNKTGTDVVASLSVDGYTNFANLSFDWEVALQDSEEEVEFVKNEDNSITIKNAQKGKYQIKATSTMFTSDVSVNKTVADVDVDSLLLKLLPFIAILMVLLVIAFFVVKKHLNNYRSLDRKLKSSSMGLYRLEKNLIDTPKKKVFIAGLMATKHNLKNAIIETENLDRESMGQHQPLLSTLNNAYNICVAALASKDKIPSEKYAEFINKLNICYVQQAASICFELTQALESFNNQKKVDTAEVIDPDRKQEQKADYLTMYENFFIKGDNFDEANDDNTNNGESDNNS